MKSAGEIADEVIAACKLKVGCRGTIVGAIVEGARYAARAERERLAEAMVAVHRETTAQGRLALNALLDKMGVPQ